MSGDRLSITYLRSPRELSGTLQTPAGAPVSDVVVIAFATDRSLWGSGARRIRAARPAADGRFEMTLLPPGDYFLAALTDVDQDEWQDPGFLDRVIPRPSRSRSRLEKRKSSTCASAGDKANNHEGYFFLLSCSIVAFAALPSASDTVSCICCSDGSPPRRPCPACRRPCRRRGSWPSSSSPTRGDRTGRRPSAPPVRPSPSSRSCPCPCRPSCPCSGTSGRRTPRAAARSRRRTRRSTPSCCRSCCGFCVAPTAKSL